MNTVLPPDLVELVAKAEAGDVASWGRLYGIAGAVLTGSGDLPSPLREVIASRLSSLSEQLAARPLRDLREVLPEAVAPGPKSTHGRIRGRARGPKMQAFSRVELAAQAALDMLAADNRRGRRVAVVKQVAAMAGCEPSSVERLMSTLSKSPNTG